MKFFLVIFTISIFLLNPFNVSAENVSTNSANVNYLLAYPGILPDNPLYKIKVLRDKIIARLIRDKVNKIEFDLLLADKTIYASKLLADKGNIPLAKETAIKGENYFTILVTDYKWAFWSGEKIPKKLDEKIKNASLKHRQVITEMMQKTNNDDKKTYENILSFIKRNNEELVNVKAQKDK